jgi:hypothetical protein
MKPALIAKSVFSISNFVSLENYTPVNAPQEPLEEPSIRPRETHSRGETVGGTRSGMTMTLYDANEEISSAYEASRCTEA